MLNRSFLLSLIWMIVSLIIVGTLSMRSKPVVIQTNLERLPTEITGYRSTEDAFSESVYKILNADKHLYRHYRNDNTNLDLYIGYYGTAKGGRTGHSPYVCLPGAGWTIVDTKKIMVTPPNASKVEINYVQARRDGINTIMYHWYQTAGTKVISSGLSQNLQRFRSRLLRNRDDGAFVQITSQVSDEQIAATNSKINNFSGNVIALLPRYWPIEK